MRRLLLVLTCLCPMVASLGAESPSLSLRSADGAEQALMTLGELPTALAKTTAEGDLRLVVRGRHALHDVLRLNVRPVQRLIIEGKPGETVLDLHELPQDGAALCLESGSFELRGLTFLYGPAWSVQVSQGVRYQLIGLRISDARGGGIVVWGPCGVDQSGPTGNRIEHCIVERFNTTKAKWTHDAISVRDNEAIIREDIVCDSPTETMGIRVMGAGNRVEGNLVQNVATGDAGGIYLWGGEAIYTAVGAVVRHNIVVGSSRGIYLDDGTCAVRVEQNYLADCSQAAVFIGGGRDNRIDQNIALRCPILAHLDNRRAGWRAMPEKAAVFAAARSRLAKALQDSGLRTRIAAAGLDVRAFETLNESAFNEPAGNLITRNLLMPAAQELRWQNYARFDQPLTGAATAPAKPNRMSAAPGGEWQTLSAKALGIPSMPDISNLLHALPSP